MLWHLPEGMERNREEICQSCLFPSGIRARHFLMNMSRVLLLELICSVTLCFIPQHRNAYKIYDWEGIREGYGTKNCIKMMRLPVEFSPVATLVLTKIAYVFKITRMSLVSVLLQKIVHPSCYCYRWLKVKR
jgi:hypothetical protein